MAKLDGGEAKLRHGQHRECGRVVFNIKANNYRLVAAIDYRRQILFVKRIGTGDFEAVRSARRVLIWNAGRRQLD